MTEPERRIAVVGIGCRFPGAVGVDAFWRLLADGCDATSEVPADRFDIASLYQPGEPRSGKLGTSRGGFLSDAGRFDAEFFSISPREASRMDPLQRLILEVAWEALEDAGCAGGLASKPRTGVFVGACWDDFACLRYEASAKFDVYSLAGTSRSSIAGRISFAFGFEGPSVVVDAACASSLVAVHLACQSLRTGESQLALAGGVNLILHPAAGIGFSQASMLAPDGRCKTFSAAADGFARSDGAGVVVLKPLAQALADGDRIYAVIVGSAANNDGDSAGLLMTPSAVGQELVLRQAYADASLDPARVSYIEAHGTGTRVGDPIEARALGAVLGPGRPGTSPCRIGSVKSNFGHTEGAAGIAGLIKASLCLHRGTLVPSLHCDRANPEIPWRELGLLVQRDLEPWPAGMAAYAGVSSFGLAGTNAHVVLAALAEAAGAVEPRRRAPERQPRASLLTLSANRPEALRELAAAWIPRLQAADGELEDLCYSAAVRRRHFPHRLGLAIREPAAGAAALSGFLDGESGPGLEVGIAAASPPAIVFVFPGQGSQWLGMGRSLLRSEPVFREVLERCEAAMRPHVEWSLLEQLIADAESSRLDEVDVVQPLLFALQVALAALWRSWGIEPAVVVGQSLGEVAAAQVAGALSLEDAATIICRRSQLVKTVSGRGAMASVELGLAEVQAAIAGYAGRVSVAVSSGPTSTVISGDADAVAEVVESFGRREVFSRVIKVDYASHSPHMDPLAPRLAAALRGLAPRSPSCAMLSTVTGQVVDGGELDAEYWMRNLRDPVLFAPAIDRLLADGHRLFLEISPHPLLLTSIQQSMRHAGANGFALGSWKRGEPERTAMLSTLAALYVQGSPVAWPALFDDQAAWTGLPPYPWQGAPFPLGASDVPGAPAWHPPAGRAAATGKPGHPLLGDRLAAATAPEVRLWQADLGPEALPFLADHRVRGAVVLAAAAILEMALAAAREAFGAAAVRLRNVLFEEALLLPEQGGRRVQVAISPGLPGSATFRLFSADPAAGPEGESKWTLHATGTVDLRQAEAAEPAPPEDLALVRARCPKQLGAAEHYAAMARHGLNYGPCFQGMCELRQGSGEALGRVELPPECAPRVGFHAHPALLDAALQVIEAALLSLPERAAGEETWLPVGVAELSLAGPLAGPLWSHARLHPGGSEPTRRGDVLLLDDDGRLRGEIRGLLLKRVAMAWSADQGAQDPADWLYALQWRPAPDASEPAVAARVAGTGSGGPGTEPGAWLLLADRSGVAEALATGCTTAGTRCLLAWPGEEFRALGDDRYQIDPASLADYEALARIARSSPGGCRAALHLWSLDLATAAEAGAAEVSAASELGMLSAAYLVRALTPAGGNGATASPSRPPSLWLVTRGAQQAGAEADVPSSVVQSPLWGLGRAIAYEHPELSLRLVDLDPREPAAAASAAAMGAEMRRADAETQVLLRAGGRLVARLERRSGEPEAAAVKVLAEGVPYRLAGSPALILDGLSLRQIPEAKPEPGEVKIELRAVGLNFRDVMLALGMLPSRRAELDLGWECAGTVVAVGEGVTSPAVGDEVAAFAVGCCGSHCVTPAIWAKPKPSHLTWEEAATILMVFATAHYGLRRLARLERGERLLVHSASGGVGLAAVQIAQSLGCEIFATAGSPEKRQYLRSLGIERVMDSRSLSFAEEVLAATDGEGVDVVLNSLPGATLRRSFELLRPLGRFVEIGKTDILGHQQLDMAPFDKSISFLAIDLLELNRSRPEVGERLLREVVEMFERGELRPLPVRTFPITAAVEAFQYMARARHIGKVALSCAVEKVEVEALSTPVRADGTYLVTGGTGGLGLCVARWLVENGARHLVLLSRSAPGEAAQVAMAELRQAAARVEALQVDVADAAALAEALVGVRRSFPPLRGVLHCAGVLADGTLPQLDRERFRTVTRPKIDGAWNLHRTTAEDPLEVFVLFSSAASLLGSPGQANYCAANAFLDGLAQHRRALGLPAISIQWGPWTEVGLAAARADRGARLAMRGIAGMAPAAALTALAAVWKRAPANIAILPLDLEQWRRFYPAAAASPFFDSLRASDEGQEASSGPREAGLTRTDLLSATAADRDATLQRYLRQHVSRILGLIPADLVFDRPLNKLGLDSLMAVELRNRVESDLGISVPVVSLLQGPTVIELAERLGRELAPVASTGPVAESRDAVMVGAAGLETPAALVARIDELSALELDRLLTELDSDAGAAAE
jgi:phthiocerol/phenolphthiocerol synthesis type-I polyketide synthase C